MNKCCEYWYGFPTPLIFLRPDTHLFRSTFFSTPILTRHHSDRCSGTHRMNWDPCLLSSKLWERKYRIQVLFCYGAARSPSLTAQSIAQCHCKRGSSFDQWHHSCWKCQKSVKGTGSSCLQIIHQSCNSECSVCSQTPVVPFALPTFWDLPPKCKLSQILL